MKYPSAPLNPITATHTKNRGFPSSSKPIRFAPQAPHHRFSTSFFPSTSKSLFQQPFCFLIYTKRGACRHPSLKKPRAPETRAERQERLYNSGTSKRSRQDVQFLTLPLIYARQA